MNLAVCTNCGNPYPLTGTPFQCECGGVFDLVDLPNFDLAKVDPSKTGMWRYAAMFALDPDSPEITLGEGSTPLVEMNSAKGRAYAKLEYQNPTGSYKDRGSAVLMSFLASRGVTQVVEDSSGNAGASLAAYAARAGVAARVFIPASASGPKRKQIEFYGAELALIPGPRVEAAKVVRAAAESGLPYASHAFMPFGLSGIATIAYELVTDLDGQVPGTIVAPVGHGGLLYGIMKGFASMQKAGVIASEPYYLGVQTAACSPVFDAYEKDDFTLREPQESDTIAEGVRVSHPMRGEAILRKIKAGQGSITKINEEDLVSAYRQLSESGFFVEPTSALVWAALNTSLEKLPEPIILILTGSGYKTQF